MTLFSCMQLTCLTKWCWSGCVMRGLPTIWRRHRQSSMLWSGSKPCRWAWSISMSSCASSRRVCLSKLYWNWPVILREKRKVAKSKVVSVFHASWTLINAQRWCKACQKHQRPITTSRSCYMLSKTLCNPRPRPMTRCLTHWITSRESILSTMHWIQQPSGLLRTLTTFSWIKASENRSKIGVCRSYRMLWKKVNLMC